MPPECLNHPVIIINTEGLDDSVTVVLMTSFHNKPLPENSRKWAFHLPVQSATPHPTYRTILRLTDASAWDNRRHSYANIKTTYQVNRRLIKPWWDNKWFQLTPESFRDLVSIISVAQGLRSVSLSRPTKYSGTPNYGTMGPEMSPERVSISAAGMDSSTTITPLLRGHPEEQRQLPYWSAPLPDPPRVYFDRNQWEEKGYSAMCTKWCLIVSICLLVVGLCVIAILFNAYT
ncbi:hypothetical protein ASPWEDRAFT_45356 [Aspergillus wentii DTO 134E9]|uniref:Uncharacterized protein n=1 Tax=Aspergillus wentii DTO 134E9 TaxID=1073089 RepID=A0A1L9R924_ASPWE|nr:uncharacterized protein ASPWEDRAFT_45356 [Aspergillus wentii DTO 134E9]OJJ31425.1 hypothetical protein ASPWEDRAFT_45356 [Aspergillus wentii DTO 134E9]